MSLHGKKEMLACWLAMRKEVYADDFKKKHLNVALKAMTVSLRRSGRILITPFLLTYLEKAF